MIALALISDNVPSLKLSDTCRMALRWMGDFKVSQLPILENGQFMGSISEPDLLEIEDEGLTLGEVNLELDKEHFVTENTHVYEVLRMMASDKLELLPVLNDEGQFEGVITANELLSFLSKLLAVNEPGGLIMLKIPQHGYSLSEIGRICESDNAKVLSLSISNVENTNMLFVTIKLNVQELSSVIATFERFNYEIEAVVFDAEQRVDYQENYQALLKYLNM